MSLIVMIESAYWDCTAEGSRKKSYFAFFKGVGSAEAEKVRYDWF